MTIKIFIFLFMSLLNQDSILIQQNNAHVQVADVDSYVHDLPPFVREKIASDNQQLESDIMGMLNMNIINDYIQNSGLIKQAAFQEVIRDFEKKSLNIDKNFYEKLDVEPQQFKDNYRHYLLKKALYSTLQSYLIDNVDDEKAGRLAQDRFSINKEVYQIPQKRDIGMIQLSHDTYNQAQVLELVKSLKSEDTIEAFKKSAKQLSQDSTVKYNDGQLGQFHQAGFRYPFAEEVFLANVGTVPTVFSKDGFWYIVRVNKIVPAKPAKFEDFKSDMVAKIRNEMMERQFQGIINEYAQHKLKSLKSWWMLSLAVMRYLDNP